MSNGRIRQTVTRLIVQANRIDSNLILIYNNYTNIKLEDMKMLYVYAVLVNIVGSIRDAIRIEWRYQKTKYSKYPNIVDIG